MDISEVKEAVKASLELVTAEQKEAVKKCIETTDRALAEIKEFGTLTTETNEKLKEVLEKSATLQSEVLDLQQRVAGFKQEEKTVQLQSIGQIVIDSPEFKAALSAKNANKMDSVEVGSFHKAILNATGQNQPLVSTMRIPMVEPINRKLTMRALIPVTSTTSNLIEYAKETVFTNNAAVQYSSPNYEGVTKPESNITFTLATAPVVTIAHWLAASRQVLSDASMLQSYIENRLMYGVAYAEDDEVLNGDGSAGHLDGLMHQATAYAGSGALSADQQLDTLLRAITQVRTGSLLVADGAVVNPIDWMKIRLIKDTTGQYVFGDPSSNQLPSVWGLPLVVSDAIASTRFLVGAFRMGAQLWDREDATVRVAEQHADFFIRNMVAILGEERIALTVFRPTAMVRGNF